MLQIRTCAACAAIFLSAVATTATAKQPDITEGEAELAEMLEGRVAGEPQRCISAMPQANMTVIDHTALVFREGSMFYVNRPSNVDLLDWNDLPVIERQGSQLCKMDKIELRDRTSFMRGPYLFLSDFTPYSKADKAEPEGDGQ